MTPVFKQRMRRAILFAPICYGVVGFVLLCLNAFGIGSEYGDTINFVSGGVFSLQTLLKIGTVITLFFLIIEFARRFADPESGWHRWVQSVGVLIATTSATVLITFLNHDFVQRGINNAAYRRMSPDDFHEVMFAGLTKVGDGPDFYPNFLNPNILTTELLAVVFIVIAAFGTIWIFRRKPQLAAVLTPVTIFASLWFYGTKFAPWSYIPDYDIFVGDMVLGAMLGELILLPFAFDEIAAILFGLNTAASLLLIRYWVRNRSNP